MTEYTIKTEDRYPLFETELGINLSTATEVRLYVEHSSSETLVVNSATTITDAATGSVEYQFTNDETARGGYHRAELVVDYSDGTRSFPEKGYYTFEFTETVDRSASVDPAEAGPSIDVTTITVDDTSTLKGNIVDSAGEVLYNQSVVTQSKLGGPASSLTSYPLPESDLAKNFVDAAGDTMSGDLTVNAAHIVSRSSNQLTLKESDATDPEDGWVLSKNNDDLYFRFYDKSANTFTDNLSIAQNGDLGISGSVDNAGSQWNLQAEGNTVYNVHHTYPKVRLSAVDANLPNFGIHDENGSAILVADRTGVDIPNGNLDLGTNDINTVGRIKQRIPAWNAGDHMRVGADNSAGSEMWRLYWNDSSAGTTTDLIEADANGNVEVPNGNLTVGGNITFNNNLIDGTGLTRLGYNTADTVLHTGNDANGGVRIFDEYNNINVLKAKVGGNVDIPNGHLSNSKGNLTLKQTGAKYGETRLEIMNEAGANGAKFVQAGTENLVDFLFREPSGSKWNQRIEARSGSAYLSAPEIKWGIAGNGLDEAFVIDSNGNAVFRSILNSFETLRLNDTGNVDIPNGDLQVDGINQTIGGRRMLAGNGVRTLLFTSPGDGTGNASIYDEANSQDIAKFHEGGKVEIQNGALDVFGNPINNVSSLFLNDANGDGTQFYLQEEAGNFALNEDTNFNNLLEVTTGGDVSVAYGSITQGKNPSGSITETTSPTGFTFSGSGERDIHVRQVVSLSNSSTASATEDVTVTLYDGSDNTGTQLATQTKSVTLASGGSVNEWFNSSELSLNNGTYYVEVTTSGTTLSVDSTREDTKGATYEFGQSNVGDLFLRNQDGMDVFTVDAIDETTTFKNGNVDLSTNDLTGVNAIHTPTSALGIWTGGSGTDRVIIMDKDSGLAIAKFNEGGKVEIPNGDLDIGTNQIVGAEGTLDLDVGTSAIRLGADGSGSGLISIYDYANNQDIILANEGGNVDIPNGKLVGGNLEIRWNNTNAELFATAAGVDTLFYDSNSLQQLAIREGGDIQIPNGNLSLNSNSLVDLRSSSTALAAADLATGEVAMDEANGRLVWKDASGSAYYAAGSALA